jgi:aspartate/methionine/tyrosine aminotransferase
MTGDLTVSRRAAQVIAHSYDDYPVGDGALDLRGDGSLPLRATTSALASAPVTAQAAASYGPIAGDDLLRGALAALVGVDPDHVVVTVGGSEALHLTLLCLTDPGAEIALPRPAFPGFDQLAGLLGLRIRHYDVPGPLPRHAPGPLLVCTPHNPTGVTTAAGALAGRPGWTIWDLSHTLLGSGELASVGAGLACGDVVVLSLSKLLRLPGVRVGCLLSPNRDLVSAAVRMKTHLSMSVDRLAQHLAAEVLGDPDTFTELAERAAMFAGLRRQVLHSVAQSGGLTSIAGDLDGTHVMVRTLDGGDAFKRLAAGGVIGLPGTVFGGPADTVRLCIAQDPLTIGWAATRLASL